MTTFGELSEDEKKNLLYAYYVRRVPVQINVHSEWLNMPITYWHNHECYRIVKAKPSIDWDHVNSVYNYLARDRNGDGYLFTDKPEIGANYWINDCAWGHSNAIEVSTHVSYAQGDCDWKDSLVERVDSN